MVVNPVTSEADYREVLAIRRQVFVGEQGVPAELEVDEHEQTARFFLARDADGRAVGTGRYRAKGPFVKFERIATVAALRGQGVGRALMAAMEEAAAREMPRHLPYMHAQADAIGFYERLGWRGVGPRFFEAGIEHLAMVKVPEDAARRRELLCLEARMAAEVAPEVLAAVRGA